MLPTTIEAITAILKADATVTPNERVTMIALLKEHGRTGQTGNTVALLERRILRRVDVARILACSTRAVDYMASQGILRKVVLPGRKRSRGFVSVEVDRLLDGVQKKGV